MHFFNADIIKSELEKLGLSDAKHIFYNLPRTDLITKAILDQEGVFSDSGALVVNTSPFTGRSPNDKYIVENSDPDLWFASGTEPLSFDKYQKIKAKMISKMRTQKLYVRDVWAGADRQHAAKVRVITDLAWQNLAAANMFIPLGYSPSHLDPDFTLLVSSEFAADPVVDGLRSPALVIMNFDEKIILVGTTRYGGEIKKSVFTYMNYILPKKGILSLHCSANKAPNGDTALFFGLSGTGKTTLSSDPNRSLIGDDEHGWSEEGIFNFEGGCYAKTIRINPKYEPLVWSAINRFGTLLENVPLDENHHPDFDSNMITENTRASYPLEFIENFDPAGTGGHPKHIFFLTADAFGVMPPLAKLNTEQAMFYFLSGYTSKLAGTERGLGDKPQATFSTCFGDPFLPLKPAIYAQLLADNLARHHTQVWLLNTGWTGGGFCIGQRISLPITRAMIAAVLSGSLDHASFHMHPVFNIAIPDSVEGVSDQILNPEKNWSDNNEYYTEALTLSEKFNRNFNKYKNSVPDSVFNSGPRGSL